MPQFPVKSPLKHDGKPYTPGKTVTMELTDAQPLIEIGVLGKAKGGKGAQKGKAEQ